MTSDDKATIKRMGNAEACRKHFNMGLTRAHWTAFGGYFPCKACALSVLKAARAKPAKWRARKVRW